MLKQKGIQLAGISESRRRGFWSPLLFDKSLPPTPKL